MKSVLSALHILFKGPSGIKTKEFKSRIYRNINVTDVKIVYSANKTNTCYMQSFNIFLA